MPDTKEITKKADTVEKTAGNKAAVSKTEETVAYIGPTIPKVATRGNIYGGGIPGNLTKKIEEIPAIKELLVPVTQLAKARKEVRTEGSYLNTIYAHVESELRA